MDEVNIRILNTLTPSTLAALVVALTYSESSDEEEEDKINQLIEHILKIMVGVVGYKDSLQMIVDGGGIIDTAKPN